MGSSRIKKTSAITRFEILTDQRIALGLRILTTLETSGLSLAEIEQLCRDMEAHQGISSPNPAQTLLDKSEWELLQLKSEGWADRIIAKRLNVCRSTVANRLKVICQKLRIPKDVEKNQGVVVVKLAVQYGCIAGPQVAPVAPLAKMEKAILLLMMAGFTAEATAARLSRSVATIAKHYSNIYNKFGAHSQEETVARAVLLGYE